MLRKAAMKGAVSPSGADGYLWTQMDGSLQEQCRGALLAIFQREANGDVQHKIADAVAEVARIQSDYGEWNDLLSLLFTINVGTNEHLCSGCLRVLAAVPEVVENRPSLKEVSMMLQSCMTHNSLKVRLEAIRALASMVYVFEDEQDKLVCFQDIVNVMPEFIASMTTEPEMQSEVFVSLIDMAMSAPKLFKAVMKPLCATIIPLVQSSEGDEDVRKGGLELVLTLLETVKGAKKEKELIGQVLHLLLVLVAEVEEDQSIWCQREPEDDDLCEEEIVSMFAEQSLDRMAMDLGGKVLVPHFFTLLPQMLQSPAWRNKYAGFRSLAAVAEGCLDQLEDNLEAVLAFIWPCFSDPNPRVQYAACHALGQLCTDFDGAIQSTHGLSDKALSSLVGVLVNSGQPRVQAHAAAALINFAEGVESEALQPYLDELLTRLVGLLASPVVYLQSQLMATIAAFSSAAGTAFSRYYSAIVPILMQCLATPTDPSDRPRRQLQCRALEAMSLVFLAVGREQINAADLQSFIKHLVDLQQSNLSEDDEMGSFLSSAWVRMSTVLGSDIAQFLPLIIPPLLQKAGQKADLKSFDLDESIEGYDENEWEFATIRGKRIGLRTATLDSKLEALQDLTTFIEALGTAYLPVAGETLNVVVPLLHFSLDENIQAAAAEVLAQLLSAMYPVDPVQSSQPVSTVMNELLKSCTEESFNLDYTFAALDAMADIINIKGVVANVLGKPFMDAVFQVVPQLLQLIVQALAEKLEREDEEDEEYDGEMDDCEDEEALMYAMSRFFAALFKAYGPVCAPPTGPLVTFCSQSVLARQASPSMKHACLCILDDLIHWTGPDSAVYMDTITRALAEGLQEHDDTDVRQASLFGVGMCAEHGGQAYHPFLDIAISSLVQILSSPNAKAPSQREATDNAVSATGRILLARPHLVTPAVLSPWLAAFPVLEDSDEVIPAYRALSQLVSNGVVPKSDALSAAIAPALQIPKDPFASDPSLRALLTQLI